MKLKKAYLLFILISTFGFCKAPNIDMPCDDADVITQNPIKQIKCKTKNEPTPSSVYCNELPAYNSPARLDLQSCWNFEISASFIYWKWDMTGMDLGLVSSSDLTNHPSEIINISTDYTPGFKVLLGTYFDYDHWNINAMYTRFHTKERELRKPPLWGQIITDTFSQTSALPSIAGRWTPKFDYFDLDIGRPYYNGKHLILKPYIGAKGGWNKNKFKMTTLLNNQKQVARLRSATWFVGPKAALDIDWLLGLGFRFFANSAISLNYQHFNSTYQLTSSFDPITLTRNSRAHTHQITPIIEMTPGLSYAIFFDHNNWHFDFAMAYNFLCFFNQNDIMGIQGFREYNNYHSTGDFILHGLEVRFKFDF
jgi:Legionella pneumophila major outer membrane protein precursor